MNFNFKPLDWVVIFYVGYIWLKENQYLLFLFVLFWLFLFEIWVMLKNKIDLQIWRIEKYQLSDGKMLTSSALAIIGNIIYQYINTKNLTIKNIIPMPTLLVILATAIAEELLFRESLFIGIENLISAEGKQKGHKDVAKFHQPRMNSIKNISEKNLTLFFSSLFFSITHILNYWSGYRIRYLIPQMVIAFIMGILLGTMRLHFGRIKECVWTHFLFNLVSYL